MPLEAKTCDRKCEKQIQQSLFGRSSVQRGAQIAAHSRKIEASKLPFGRSNCAQCTMNSKSASKSCKSCKSKSACKSFLEQKGGRIRTNHLHEKIHADDFPDPLKSLNVKYSWRKSCSNTGLKELARVMVTACA